MPVLTDWDAYMDASKVAALGKIDSEDFFANHTFGDKLMHANTGEVCDVRNRCRDFMNHFVDAILSLHLVTGSFYQSIYCFCPEILLEGDDWNTFGLFGKTVRVLEKVGCLSRDAVTASLDEFTAFVVEARLRHRESGWVASAINDVVAYLLADYGFLWRFNLVRTLQLCCLVVLRTPLQLPTIDIGFAGCSAPADVVDSAFKCVQSYVRMPSFKQGAFLQLPQKLQYVIQPLRRKSLWILLILIDLPKLHFVIVLLSSVVLVSCLMPIWPGRRKALKIVFVVFLNIRRSCVLVLLLCLVRFTCCFLCTEYRMCC